MRIVLDTNVLFSALISPYGVPHIIYSAWREAKFDLITSTHQLEELRRASRYPKFKSILQPAKVGTMINHLQHAIILDRHDIEIEVQDQNDAFLLGMSVHGNAHYLVTGDHRAGLLQMASYQKTQILTPSAFCSQVLR